MMGWVGVQIVFPESIDDRECNESLGIYTENWTISQRFRVLRDTREALQKAFAEPQDRDLKFLLRTPRVIPVHYEPVTLPTSDFGWQEEIYDSLGFTVGDWRERGFAYNNHLRSLIKTDWFVHTFVVNDSCDADNLFPGPFISPYSSYYGPRDVLLLSWAGFGNNTIAHEFAHMFGAPDEYNHWPCLSEQGCTDEWGYLRVPNQNCARCLEQVPCLMNGAWDESGEGRHPLCEWTKGHLGWRDSDEPRGRYL